ncbi:MAG TPA: amino acid-binding protein, partial [Chloroflexota bacterium]
RPGTGRRVLDAVGRAGINIIGACALSQGGNSTVHLAVEDASAMRQALEGAGVSVFGEQEVLISPIDDRPGAGAEILGRLADAGLNVEFLYLATDNRIILGVEDLERTRAVL